MQSETSRTPVETLIALERSLHDQSVRKDRSQLDQLLSDDFREIGSSGRVWTRGEIFDLLADETAFAMESSGFVSTFLAPDVALLTYTTIARRPGQPERRALRSSIWRLEGNRWRIVFHQGTPQA